MFKPALLALALIGVLLAPSFARADVIMDGYHPVSTCYEIENLEEFPDYTVLLVSSDPLPATVQLGARDCASFYKFDTGTFAALRTETFEKLLGENTVVEGWVWEPDDMGGYGSSTWGKNHADDMTQSGVTLTHYDPQQVPDSNPLSRVDMIYRITELNAERFTVEQTSVRYSYLDGDSEEVNFVRAEPAFENVDETDDVKTIADEQIVEDELVADVLPEPSRDGQPKWWLLLGLPVVGVAGFLLLRKK